MQVYKTVIKWNTDQPTPEFVVAVRKQIDILMSEGKTDGNQMLTRPGTDCKRQTDRFWINEDVAKAWLDWVAANSAEEPLFTEIVPVEYFG